MSFFLRSHYLSRRRSRKALAALSSSCSREPHHQCPFQLAHCCRPSFTLGRSASTMSESGNNGRQSATLLADELFEYCQSPLLSEDVLRRIIERHGSNTNHHHHHVSDHEFFMMACINERVTEGIIQCLLEYFPAASSFTDEGERSPLHFACLNPNVTFDIIQLIIDADPDSVRRVTNGGNLPLHILCDNRELDDRTALKILMFLLQKYPEAVRYVPNNGWMYIKKGTSLCVTLQNKVTKQDEVKIK